MGSDATRSKRLSRAQAKAHTRDRLIAAATEVVARRGLAGASVDEIAEAAGYTIGALYSQFGSKNNLVVEAMHAYVAGQIEAARSIMEAASMSEQERRRAMGKLLAASGDTDTDFAPLLWTEMWLQAARNPEVGELLASEARAVDEAISSSIANRRRGTAPEEGGVSAEPGDISDEALATVVSSLFRGLAQRRRIDPASVPDELLGHALQLLVAGRRAIKHNGMEGQS